ncbi:MAG: hypothetical protein KC506_01755 [Nanoarchaeota archaeon]|nr:hypothetical protein [Nanoarchaeota archaeon]
MRNTKQINAEKEIEIIREYEFSPEELFVLGYLKNFNRRASRAWAEDSFSGFSSSA